MRAVPKWAKGQKVKSYRNCVGSVYTVLTRHKNGSVTVKSDETGQVFHRFPADMFYNAGRPDCFVPMGQPLPDFHPER